MTKTKYGENLEKHSINTIDHAAYYNFENSDELVNNFMSVFEQKFVPRDGSKNLFKCSYTIVNSHPPPAQDAVEIEDSRTWTISAHQGVHFNEYVKFLLISDIKKGIIINGLTGSSWRFKRFDHLSLSVNNFDDQRVLKMEFIEKYARVEADGEEDDSEEEMAAEADQVRHLSDDKFIDDKNSFEDQQPSDYNLSM